VNAHVAFHFALGMGVGSAVGFPTVLRAWYFRRPLARPFLHWFAWCYGAGVFAVVPSILRSFGLPPGLCGHWSMNVFLLHPLVDRLRPGGLLVGELAMGAVAGAQYAMILLAIGTARARAVAP